MQWNGFIYTICVLLGSATDLSFSYSVTIIVFLQTAVAFYQEFLKAWALIFATGEDEEWELKGAVMSFSCFSLSRAQSCDGGRFCLWDCPPVCSDNWGDAVERHWVCLNTPRYPHKPGRVASLHHLLYLWFLSFRDQIWDGVRIWCQGWTIRSVLFFQNQLLLVFLDLV